MPSTYNVPAMSLRLYEEAVCHPRQILVKGNVVLPDSFRWNNTPRLRNKFLRDVGADNALPPRRMPGAEVVPGTHFYLDSEWTGHFGHVLTEQLSRLWAMDDAREVEPALKAVLSRRGGRTGLTEFEREVFGAFGLEESDFLLIDRPVRVERVLAASPMFSMPTHVHPELIETWDRVGRLIAAKSPDRDYPRRVFCSRRADRRACRNVDEVEEYFGAHGFTVVYPERLPFAEQVRMFREAEVIAGFAGSGLFTAALSGSPRRMIVLGPTSYPARNEYMICAVAGHRLDHVWSIPGEEELAAASQARFAGFKFDFNREGPFLEHIIQDC